MPDPNLFTSHRCCTPGTHIHCHQFPKKPNRHARVSPLKKTPLPRFGIQGGEGTVNEQQMPVPATVETRLTRVVLCSREFPTLEKRGEEHSKGNKRLLVLNPSKRQKKRKEKKEHYPRPYQTGQPQRHGTWPDPQTRQDKKAIHNSK